MVSEPIPLLLLQPKWVEVRLNDRGAQVVQLDPSQAAELVLWGARGHRFSGWRDQAICLLCDQGQAGTAGRCHRAVHKQASIPRSPQVHGAEGGWQAGQCRLLSGGWGSGRASCSSSEALSFNNPNRRFFSLGFGLFFPLPMWGILQTFFLLLSCNAVATNCSSLPWCGGRREEEGREYLV